MEDQVAELSKSKYFFTLDLKCAYYQVSISPEGKKYTGFETLGKLLSIHPRAIRSNEWSVGFSKNIINTVIQKHGLRHTYAYLDNIAVGGATVEERVKNIAAFLKSRKKKIVHLTKKRSANRATEIDLLGYRLSFGSIRPDPNRLKPLIELKSNPHKLKRTMDMSGFLRSNKSIWLSESLYFANKTWALRRRGNVLKLIQSYLSNRKQYVQGGYIKSSLNSIISWVTQSLILGPLFFNIYKRLT